ncbi:hypothetical protein FOA52_009853 [Chlamydomonas sp. UWO 241]|nr:hypothetical protein FOA52_009853 [Chlamydomonas sp. UWO 241]
MQGLPPSKLVVPPVCADGIVRMLNVIDELQGGREPMKYELLPLAPGQEMQLPSGFVVRPFATTHTVTSQGYVIYSQRKRLCADLQGSSQEEIRDARLAGREVTEVFEVPEVAFTGDTTSAFFDGPHPAAAAAADDDPAPAFAAAAAADADSDSGSLPVSTSAHGAPPSAPSGASPPAAAVPPARALSGSLPVSTSAHGAPPSAQSGASPPSMPPARALSLLDDVLRAKLLIIELTFLDDSVIVEQAREKGHMHIADFVANAHRFQNEAILLVHFSARYSRKQILEALNTWLPPALRARCVPFLNGIA